MKLFVYKTIFVLIGIYILYQVTIGIKIGDYEKKIKNLTNDQGREMIRDKVREEIKKATEKEQILKDEDIQLLRNFIIKIQRELGL
tara:strand:- start:959 stop:1216 length:258 start_codon:yes stop_codon:yes gene_type:complete